MLIWRLHCNYIFILFQGASQMVGLYLPDPENSNVSSLRTSVRIQSLEDRVDALEMRDLTFHTYDETSYKRVVETSFPLDVQQPELLTQACTPVQETSDRQTNTRMVFQCEATPANEPLRQCVEQLCTDMRNIKRRVEELENTYVQSKQLDLLKSRMIDEMASMKTQFMSCMNNFEGCLDRLEKSLNALRMKMEERMNPLISLHPDQDIPPTSVK